MPLLVLIATGFALFEIELDIQEFTIIHTIYDSHRSFFIVIPVILVTIIFCRNCFSNRILPHTLTEKAEKQLLYETIFVSSWKFVNLVVYLVFINIQNTDFTNVCLPMIADLSIYISNVGGLIFLFFVSTLVKNGFKRAIGKVTTSSVIKDKTSVVKVFAIKRLTVHK